MPAALPVRSGLRRRFLQMLPALLVALPLTQVPALAHGGHGGGGGGGGGGHWHGGGGGGGHWHGGGGGGGYHHVYGGGVRTPALGHNISRDDYNRATRGGQDRFDASRLGWGNRNWNDGAWHGNNWRGDGWNNRNWNGNDWQAGNWNNRWNDNWRNGGYWGNRPWSYGWYNWSPDSWGWWGDNGAAWGLAGLATGAVITDLVDQAGDQQSSVIQVPDSNYQLNYGSVDAVGNSGANFSYAVSNSPPLQGGADCQDGLLDGQVPSTAAQAQLLNAACQVAYGPDPKGQPLPQLWSPSPAVREWLILLLGAGIGCGAYALARRGRPTA